MFTRTQRRLLRVLQDTAGQVVPYRDLAARVWPEAEHDAKLQDCMRVTAYAINEQLRDDGEPGRILAERGVGYAWFGELSPITLWALDVDYTEPPSGQASAT